MAFFDVAPGAPGVRQADFKNSLTVVHDDNTGQYGSIVPYFGEPQHGTVQIDPRTNQPVESMSLYNAYSGRNEVINKTNEYLFINGDGWWFQANPLRRAEGLSVSWSQYNVGQFAMDAAPEDTSPRYVYVRHTSHTDSLGRFSLGFKARHDFFKTPGGVAEFNLHQKILVQAAWISAKLLVQGSLLSCKLPYREWQAAVGPSYPSVAEAMASEIDLFGALTRDKFGLYKLWAHVNETTQNRPQKWDMLVMPSGSFADLAMGMNSIEVDVKARGLSGVKKTLVLGGKSMTTALSGANITLYEDMTYNLENVEAVDLRPMRRLSTTGHTVMLDASRFGADWANPEDYVASKELSVRHVSIGDVDNWVTLTLETALRGSLRFDTTPLGRLSERLQMLADRLGQEMNAAGMNIMDGLVDPYLVSRGAGGSVRDQVPVTYFGEQNTAYLSVEQSAQHGRVAAARFRQKLGATNAAGVALLRATIARVYDVDEVDASVAAFFYAVSAHPDNIVQTRGDSSSPPYLPSGRFGAPALPIVVESVVIQDQQQQQNFSTPRALAVPKAGGLGLQYVWEIISPQGEITAYVLVDAGTFPQVNGGGTARLAIAPTVPVGYGTLSGMRVLANLHSSGKGASSGWDPELLKDAYKGLRAFDAYYDALHRTYPHSAFFHPSLTPAHAYSGDALLDSQSAFAASVFDHVKQPVFVRVPGGDAARTLATGFGGGGLPASNDLINEGVLSTMLRDIGFVSAPDVGRPGAPVANPEAVRIIRSLLLEEALPDSRAVQTLVDPRMRAGFLALAQLPLIMRSYIVNVLAQRGMVPPQGPTPEPTLATFITGEILSRGQAGVLNGESLGLLLSVVGYVLQTSNDITQVQIDEWAEFGRERVRRVQSADARRPGTNFARDRGKWVNSRLVLSHRAWTNSLARALNGGDQSAGVDAFLRLPVRPMDPDRPTLPLAPYLGGALQGDQTEAQRVEATKRDIGRLRSCALDGSFNDTVLAHGHVLGHSPVVQRQIDEMNERAARELGSACDPLQELGKDATRPLAQRVFLVQRFRELSAMLSDDERIPALLMSTSLVCIASIMAMYAANVPPPCGSHLFVHPHVHIYSDVAMFIASGCGELRYNWEDMTLAYNANIKNWLGHMTLWMGAFQYTPEAVFIVPDARMAGYVDGLTSVLYTNPDEEFAAPNEELMYSDSIGGAGGEAGQGAPTMFCFDVGSSWTREQYAMNNPLSLFGRYVGDQVIGARFQDPSAVLRNTTQQWPTFLYYNSIWRFTKFARHTKRDFASYTDLAASRIIPGLCFARKHLEYEQRTGGYDRAVGGGQLSIFRDWNPPMKPKLAGKMTFDDSRINGESASITDVSGAPLGRMLLK